MNKSIYCIALALFSVIFSIQAQTTSGTVLDLKSSITDNAIVYPESFEADTQKLLESWFVKNYTSADSLVYSQNDAEVTDPEIISRLNALPVVIEMPFNQIVRSYIDRYTKNERDQIAAMLGLGLYYTPIFEQALEEQGLPLELRYLPMIESGLDPNAVSKQGAAGLWQFMLGTAKGLGMEVNSIIDERRDPFLSSEMAASYLKGLHDTYNDWTLAIAAYNCGPGNVNKAIRRAGGEAKDHDFWSIYNYLPAETRGYVPMFIAVNYVMAYYPQHNISPVLPTAPLVIDTIHVADRIHFDQISNVLEIPIEEIRILNPQYRADIIPGTAENPCNLILPSQQIHAYLMSETDIKNFDADKYAVRSVVETTESPAEVIMTAEDDQIWPEELGKTEDADGNVVKTTVVHKVKAGETLASIASTYGVTTDEIKKTNNLRRNAVRVGQQLKISTSDAEAIAAAPTVEAPQPKPAEAPAKKNTSTQKKNTQQGATTYKVKKGDTLSSIAKKHGVSVTALKNANGLTSDKIKVGQNLKIPTASSGGSSKKKKR